MRLAIMQPYFFPYLGYFQLIRSVDTFVFYDDVQFIKGGYIHRNRILSPESCPSWIGISLKKASTFDLIHTRTISHEYDRAALLDYIQKVYEKAPYFALVFPLISRIIMCAESSLCKYVENSIRELSSFLGLKARFYSSEGLSTGFRGEERLLAISKVFKASDYINLIGGLALYDKKKFMDQGIRLSFLKMLPVEYKQFGDTFSPNLSIIDVLMFNSLQEVTEYLTRYELI